MFHRRFADNTSEHSVATRLRRQRFQILLDMIESTPGSPSILDIGGRPQYWDMMLKDITLTKELHITLLNVETHTVARPNFTALVGDGRAMPQFGNHQFDIVFSNSTIEHVGDFDDQRRMANEVQRVGRRYYIQTPNRYFPIEPHFVFPGFQFLPFSWRTWLVQHFKLGWYPQIPDRTEAAELVKSIRLLNRNEVAQLFPDAAIFEERIYGLIKSFVAYTPTSK
jgi:SAM-dependent methyltransferase